MKQSLEFKLGQHLTITPQLQQAIRLLQLSSAELQQEIQEELETNPMLEEDEDQGQDKQEDASTSGNGEDKIEKPAEESLQDTDVELADNAINDEYNTDTDWQDNYDYQSPINTRQNTGDDLPDIDARNSATQTLPEYLEWQMHMTSLSERDQLIAQAIINSINDDGYLDYGTEEVIQSVELNDPVEIDEYQAVLHQVQNFDPVGVGAEDLADCLSIQLRQLPKKTPHLATAMALATTENLALLAKRDQPTLRRTLKLTQEQLQQTIELIQSLNPRPGSAMPSTQTNYIIPDILVRKVKGIWKADLNSEVAPKLRINAHYEKMIHRGANSADNKYMQEHLQMARWFIKSVKSRNETLLKVAKTIVDRQRGFFDHGPEAMKPLVLHDIAESVEMHESTISRVTTNKYMLTPRGIFELKYFFSSHVHTVDGGTCSATAIRSLITKIIDQESSSKPTSDSKIAQLLETQGIHVARRTIAKYRESLNIPPSNQRKSLL